MDCSAVSSLSWVPRGYARKSPIKNAHYSMNDEEVEQYFVNHNIKRDYETDNGQINTFNNLSEDEVDCSGGNILYGGNFFHNVERGLFKCGKDPNIVKDHFVDSEEEDALEVKDGDSLLATTVIEDDVATLQVYLYSVNDGSFYVHHDIIIGDYPLCSEWLSLGHQNIRNNNVLAIGSFNCEINVWNLDFIDSIDPILTLSGKEGHSGAVMSLAGHIKNPRLLASGSADNTIKLWDLHSCSCIDTFSNCLSKVQCLDWHHTENNILISADYSKTLQFIDIRSAGQGVKFKYDAKFGEPESFIFPTEDIYESGNAIVTSTENGYIFGCDVRMLSGNSSKYRFAVLANQGSKPITSVCCTSIRNMLVSCDMEGVSKVWDLSNMADCVTSKPLKGGKMFTCSSCPDEHALVAFGGESTVLWNISQDELASKRFCG